MEQLSGLSRLNHSVHMQNISTHNGFSIHACIRNQIILSSDVTKCLVYLLWLVERSALTSGMMLYEQVPVFILSNKMRGHGKRSVDLAVEWCHGFDDGRSNPIVN